MEPQEFYEMVAAVRIYEQALGKVSYEPSPKDLKIRAFRRSLFIAEDLYAGETLTEKIPLSTSSQWSLFKSSTGPHRQKSCPRFKFGTQLQWEHVAQD